MSKASDKRKNHIERTTMFENYQDNEIVVRCPKCDVREVFKITNKEKARKAFVKHSH